MSPNAGRSQMTGDGRMAPTWRCVADSDMVALKNDGKWGFEVGVISADTGYRVEFTDAELRRCVEVTDSER